MNKDQEPKYGVSHDGFIVNRATGEAIPQDEPIFIFRASDVYACAAIKFYAQLLQIAPNHQIAVEARAWDFSAFANEYPKRMKIPSSEKY